MMRFKKFGQALPDIEPLASSAEPDWQQANPIAIARALERALARAHGNWYVVDATRRITTKPRQFRIAGQDMVAWRVNGETLMAPETCPHMGASLKTACVRNGELICPWHGLALGKGGRGSWKPYSVHDDGILTWVRVGPEDSQIPTPVLAERPTTFMEGVVRVEARCDPADVIANRLDPGGVHFHPFFRRTESYCPG